MTMIIVEAHLTSEEIIRDDEQLDASELERFIATAIALQARRRAPSLPRAESELLAQINQGIPAPVQRRYAELIARRQMERLTPEEHQELLQLTEQVEQIEARRVEVLAALAQLRGTSLSRLMADLGLATPP